ncbi:MAG: DEAD/DEAH box helicase [Lentisphaeria bacterium]|nr:DEAD/DEAH box helicase [Lentisphaeria bacterium]NQZ67287.1 DEAD/DEAH box helicase [Lentisphaeria bacterium]
MTFSDYGIKDELTAALGKQDIHEPTDIQKTALTPLMDGQDAYICSPTGTGKTLAYLLPLLTKLVLDTKDLQVMILTPTHELASQVIEEIRTLVQASALPIRSQLIIGGVSNKRQIENLKKKPHVVVGSPGRIQELINMRKLKVHKITAIVIDEADRMMFDESLDTIERIVDELQTTPQYIFASATQQNDSQETIHNLSPNIIDLSHQANELADEISHQYFEVREMEKITFCRQYIRTAEPKRAIIFVHRKEKGKELFGVLRDHKIPVSMIHGSGDKLQRVQALRDFRKGKSQILISTDIAARGLDVKDVSHVINLDVPHQSKQYLHRAGRTGRAGKEGLCVSFIDREDKRLVKRFNKELNIDMQELFMKHGKITEEKQD